VAGQPVNVANAHRGENASITALLQCDILACPCGILPFIPAGWAESRQFSGIAAAAPSR
jgi:hypothetical protein